MDEQINDAIRMAKAMAKEWETKNPRYEYEEYFGICNLAIAKSLNKFDESRGVKFTTFAYQVMHREIIRKLNTDKNYNIRYGEKVSDDMLPISLNKANSKSKNGKTVSLMDSLVGNKEVDSDLAVVDFIEKVVRENTKDRYKQNIDRDIKVLKKYIIEGYNTYDIGRQVGESGQLIGSILKKFVKNSKQYAGGLV